VERGFGLNPFRQVRQLVGLQVEQFVSVSAHVVQTLFAGFTYLVFGQKHSLILEVSFKYPNEQVVQSTELHFVHFTSIVLQFLHTLSAGSIYLLVSHLHFLF
jgi:hypothetical protein